MSKKALIIGITGQDGSYLDRKARRHEHWREPLPFGGRSGSVMRKESYVTDRSFRQVIRQLIPRRLRWQARFSKGAGQRDTLAERE